MPTLFVLILVCAGNIPREACDTRTARVYQAYRAPPGYVICGAPGMMTLAQSQVGPDGSEYTKVKCRLE